MPKDYYLILGVTSDATLDDIKDAYRRLAKEFHPDHYGDNHSPFLAIQEAYSVLSDPIRRQCHDLSVLNPEKKPKPRYGQTVRPSPRRHVEPLIPEQKPTMNLGMANPESSFHSYRPLFDELFDRLFSNVSQASQPKSEPLPNLNIVIPLTQEQAFLGGQIKVLLPAERMCPSCSGQGFVGRYQCRRCKQEGHLSGDDPVIINYPSGISNNHAVQIPLDTYGIKNRYLTVHFQISKIL